MWREINLHLNKKTDRKGEDKSDSTYHAQTFINIFIVGGKNVARSYQKPIRIALYHGS